MQNVEWLVRMMFLNPQVGMVWGNLVERRTLSCDKYRFSLR